jgi:putative phage-type endonuclease
MKQLHVEQNTPEWLEARKQYHTASEAAIVLGISPFKTPLAFKMERAGLKKSYYSAAMRRGHELEDQVRQHAENFFGCTFAPECWVNGQYMASLDGIDAARDTIVEIKVSDRTYNDLKDGNFPEYYYAQLQQQLHCSPAKVGYLYVYSPEKDAYICSAPVEEMPLYMESVDEAWEKFDAIELDEHTPVDRSDDGAIINLFGEYAGLKRKAEQIDKRMKEIKAKLEAEAGERSLVAGDFKLDRQAPAARYDYKQAAVDADVDLEAYKKPAGKPTYTMRLPKNPFEVIE